jgi:molecular chaperone GrpE
MSPSDKSNGPVEGPPDGESENVAGKAQQRGLAEEEVDASVIADLEAALENAAAELAQTTDRHLRLAAEFDNYRRRTERERSEAFGRGQSDIVTKILEPLDDLERVVQQEVNAPPDALLEGVQLVLKKLRTILQAAGLEQIDTVGMPFDPSSMEAVATVAVQHPEEDDVVADAFQHGYRFKGQLIRPARVRVKKFEA